MAWNVQCSHAAGTDRGHRAKVSARIAARTHLLWERKGVVGEWEEFLEEAVHGRPMTNLHASRPTALQLGETGAPFTD